MDKLFQQYHRESLADSENEEANLLRKLAKIRAGDFERIKIKPNEIILISPNKGWIPKKEFLCFERNVKIMYSVIHIPRSSISNQSTKITIKNIHDVTKWSFETSPDTSGTFCADYPSDFPILQKEEFLTIGWPNTEVETIIVFQGMEAE